MCCNYWLVAAEGGEDQRDGTHREETVKYSKETELTGRNVQVFKRDRTHTEECPSIQVLKHRQFIGLVA